MVVLPVMLGDLGMSAGTIGICYAIQSLTTVLLSLPMSKLADTYGASKMIGPAMILSAISMGLLPYANELYTIVPLLSLWGAATSALGMQSL